MATLARKLSISVPPDVAARLDQEDNVSAFLAETVRARMRVEERWAAAREQIRAAVPDRLDDQPAPPHSPAA